MFSQFASLFDQFFDNKMEDFETAFPGIIDKVNSDGTVDVRPSIRNVLKNMQMEPDDPKSKGKLCKIPSVPVLLPGTASVAVKFELVAGDPVLLVSSSRDLRKWISGGWSGGPYEPVSFAGNDLNSLLAIPCRLKTHGSSDPKISVTFGSDGKAEIENENGKIVLASDGTVTINSHLEIAP